MEIRKEADLLYTAGKLKAGSYSIPGDISSQYISTVKPMFDQYIRNYEQYADVIVNRGGKNAKITEILAGYINNDLHLYAGKERK